MAVQVALHLSQLPHRLRLHAVVDQRREGYGHPATTSCRSERFTVESSATRIRAESTSVEAAVVAVLLLRGVGSEGSGRRRVQVVELQHDRVHPAEEVSSSSGRVIRSDRASQQ